MDNLQPDFLYEHIQPVRAELMQVLLTWYSFGDLHTCSVLVSCDYTPDGVYVHTIIRFNFLGVKFLQFLQISNHLRKFHLTKAYMRLYFS